MLVLQKDCITGNKWGCVLLMSKSCTMLMLPSSIIYVLEIITDLEDNTNTGEIGKLQMNLFLSIFNTSVKYVGVGFFGVVSSTVSSANYIVLVTTVGCYFHLCP